MPDGGNPFARGRHFYHHVGSTDCTTKPLCLCDGSVGIVRQNRTHLKTYKSIRTVRLIVNWTEKVGRPTDVANGKGFINFEDGLPLFQQVSDLVIIIGAAGD